MTSWRDHATVAFSVGCLGDGDWSPVGTANKYTWTRPRRLSGPLSDEQGRTRTLGPRLKTQERCITL
jgi:hypothetical protein